MDTSAPATKADIRMIMDQIGKYYMETERKMTEWKRELHDDMEAWKTELHDDMKEWKNEIKDHFDLVAEQNRFDIMSVKYDKIELLDDRTNNHERRITTLETRAR